jgi:hypothetical protein
MLSYWFIDDHLEKKTGVIGVSSSTVVVKIAHDCLLAISCHFKLKSTDILLWFCKFFMVGIEKLIPEQHLTLIFKRVIESLN